MHGSKITETIAHVIQYKSLKNTLHEIEIEMKTHNHRPSHNIFSSCDSKENELTYIVLVILTDQTMLHGNQ